MIHIVIGDGTIRIAAAYPAEEGPPPELGETVAAIAALLDAADIRYTAREATATIRPAPPHRPR